MSDSPLDTSKRTWLIASGCAGAAGAAFTAVPFVSSFQPSERAKAAGAPVEVDISSLKPGEKVMFPGEEIGALAATTEQQAEDALRMIKVDWEVLPALANVEQAMPRLMMVDTAQGKPERDAGSVGRGTAPFDEV